MRKANMDGEERTGGRREGSRTPYEFALIASRSEVLCWLMMQPIRRPLAPKSLKVYCQLLGVLGTDSL